MEKKYKLMPFAGEWEDAFSQPEFGGTWLIWGQSSNGKTSFMIQLLKELSKNYKVLFDSMEEGISFNIQKICKNAGFDNNKNINIVAESIEDLQKRLKKNKSYEVILIDSFQYSQLSYKEYLKFKESLGNRLLIFTSHSEGNKPASRAAVSVLYDASLKIYVEGYVAYSRGRYIGEIGSFVIWQEGAKKYNSTNV
ncbi:MAG: ATP-dependent serine protease [Bacteroidales bacterium]|nr:ATP-dependent serine protease [Bacteroidales bacterium]